ncbi:MAG: arylamine N-acetyltransferase [Microscillaceae bacterium]|nr:arylamine N-acetyltransferase [Microscillaceae bacterium]
MNTPDKNHPENIKTNVSQLHKLDIEAYFRRIAFDGERKADLKTLRLIHYLHPQYIPFENLNSFLGLPVDLNMDAIEQKLVFNSRGGYCFEHNLLLMEVLKALGFQVKGLAARVQWNLPEDLVSPRGHMLLLVELDNRRLLVDVGFGGLTLTSPLSLDIAWDQQTTHGTFRILNQNQDVFTLQVNLQGEWKTMYTFSLEEQFWVDYKVSNWYISTHPDSHFTYMLIAGLCTPDRRYALRNNQLSVHFSDGVTEKIILETSQDIQKVLEEMLGIRLPKVDHLEAMLQKVVSQA